MYMSIAQQKRRRKTSADVLTNQAAEQGGLSLTFTKLLLEKRGQKFYAQMWRIPSSCPVLPRPPFHCIVFQIDLYASEVVSAFVRLLMLSSCCCV